MIDDATQSADTKNPLDELQTKNDTRKKPLQFASDKMSTTKWYAYTAHKYVGYVFKLGWRTITISPLL